jgi:hypothetical protein
MDEKRLAEIEARANAADVPALVAEVRRLRDVLRQIKPYLAEDFLSPEGSPIIWDAFPVTFGYAKAYRALLEALGEEKPPICPKGHSLVRIECCPKCAEDGPAVPA